MKGTLPRAWRGLGEYYGWCFEGHPLNSGIARLFVGLFFLTWVPALSMPFEVWPYMLSLPIVLHKGISRLAFAWCLVILWVWLGIPSVPGRGFALLKAVLPVIIGSATGRFIRRKHMDLLGVIFATMVPFCILSLAQWLYRVPVPSVWLSGQERWILPTRATAVYQNPNLFAGILLFLIPIGISRVPVTAPALGWGWVVMAFAGLIFTFSYGAWVAAVFSILVLAAIRFTKRPIKAVLWLTISALIVFLLIGAFHGSTATYRSSLWREVWHIFLKYPWGVGPGGLQAFLAVGPTPSSHAHNIVLQTLAETGLLGVTILLLILRKVILKIVNNSDYTDTGVAASLSGLVLYGMVDYIWAAPLLTGLFWFGLDMLEEPV